MSIPGTVISANVTAPVYDGGITSANVRQAKEQLGQAQSQANLQREQTNSAP